MQPSHTTHNHTVGLVKLPSGEGTRERVPLIIKGKQIGTVATVIFHIDPDLTIIGCIVHQIVTGHNAVGTHLTVGQHTHLEGRSLVKRQFNACRIGNLCAIGSRSLAVGSINQHGAL